MSLRIAAQPQPHPDLGDAAVELWRLRYKAEADVLACIAQSHVDLVPAARRAGMCVDAFDGDAYRLAWCVFDLSPARDRSDRLATLYRTLAATFNDMEATATIHELYDLWEGAAYRRRYYPGTSDNLKHESARLRELIAATRDADRLMLAARQKIDAAIGRAAEHETTRGTGGNTGANKHTGRRTLTEAASVKRSA